MNSNGKYLSSEIITNKESYTLKHALSAIAQELQRFYTPLAPSQSMPTVVFPTPEVKSNDVLKKLNVVRSKLSTKNRQVKKLRKNVKTAYVVAKSVMSAKQDETACLAKHIQLTRDQCEYLLQKNRSSSKVIEDLNSETQILKDNITAFEHFIDLGYNELQRMQNKPIENLPVMQQLKEIMINCGQYYSDYCSEHDKRLQLEQKNRYLTHKMNIITSSDDAFSENDSFNRKKKYAKQMMGVHEVQVSSSFYTVENKKKGKCDDLNKDKSKSLNFNSHLTVIKKMLDDQDDMLKSLNELSQELTIRK